MPGPSAGSSGPLRADVPRRECDDGGVNACALPPPVPVTALRVYEPLEAFAAGQRPALAALAEAPDAGQDAEEAERRAAWRRLLGRPPWPSDAAEDAVGDPGSVPGGAQRVPGRSEADEPGAPGRGLGVRTPGLVYARVLRAEGSILIAPAVLEPAEVPEAPGGRRHTLVRAWQLPAAWLSIVRHEDLTRSGGRGRYVLPMARARARAARTLRTLRAGLGDVEVTLDVEALARWLEQFHPRAWVEVDTRPVAALIDGEDGADDVRLGLESLTVGDAAGVAAAYQRVSRRSHRLEQLSVSS